MVLTQDDLRFLARLSKTPDGAALIKILRADLAEVDATLRKATGEELIRTQGRAQKLDELIERFNTAEKMLKPSQPTRQAIRL